jgi:signal transduction histidine kinase
MIPTGHHALQAQRQTFSRYRLRRNSVVRGSEHEHQNQTALVVSHHPSPCLLIAYIGVSSTTAISASFDTYTQKNLLTDQALRELVVVARAAIGDVNELALLYTSGGSQEAIASEEEDFARALGQLDEGFKTYEQRVKEFFAEEEGEIAEEIGSSLDTLRDRLDRFADTLRHTPTSTDIQRIRDELEEAEDNFSEVMDRALEHEAEEVAEGRETVGAQLTNAIRSILITAFVTMGIAVVGGVAISRSMSQPIRQLSSAAQQIAQGNYSRRTTISTKDEIGRLAQDFNTMAETVQKQIVQLESARAQAERADRIKSAFLSSMSHELRTPLNAIINFSKFVAKGVMGQVNDRQVDALNTVTDSAKHLLNLINDVLDISKIESGALTLFAEENVDLNELIDSALKTAQGLVGTKPVELRSEVQRDLPRMAADKQRILQILLNVLSNSCKFTQEGFILLKAEQQNGEVLITVQDTGPGIATEEQAAVFEPFKQTELAWHMAVVLD